MTESNDKGQHRSPVIPIIPGGYRIAGQCCHADSDYTGRW